MKHRDNEINLLKLNLKLEIAQKKIDEIQLQIDNVNRDILDPVIICCNITFKSHQDLRNHNNTKKCSNKLQPYVKCNMCRNIFYGLTKGDIETLGIGNIKFDVSTYGKHYRKCCSCLDCGKRFNSFEEKKYHITNKPCLEISRNLNIESVESVENSNRFKKDEILNKIIQQNTNIENIKLEDSEDSDRPQSNTSVRSFDSVSTSSQLDPWDYQNIEYFLDNKNRVYDEFENKIGIRYKDDFSEDYKIDYN
jgi:hypothetical protein